MNHTDVRDRRALTRGARSAWPDRPDGCAISANRCSLPWSG